MRRLGLLFLLLFALPAGGQEPIGKPAATVKAESGASLRGRGLGPQLDKLLIWDDQESTCRLPRLSEESPAPGRAPVLVLHLWASYCQPCLREFPLLRDFAERIEGEYHGKVRFQYVALSSSPSDLRAFLLKHRALLPKAPQYCDTLLEPELGRYLPTGLALPATLVLDQRRQIREVVLGSIGYHRAQLGRTIAQLVAATRPAGTP